MPPQNQNNINNSVVQSSDVGALEGGPSNGAWASSQQPSNPQPQPITYTDPEAAPKKNILVRLLSRVDILLAILLVLGALGLFWALYQEGRDDEVATVDSIAKDYDTVNIPLQEFAATGVGELDLANQHVVINGNLQANGQLSVNDTLTINPSAQPVNPNAGQIYFDQTSNVLAYFDGEEFVNLTAGVASVQGNTGEVTLTGTDGITITTDEAGNITFAGPDIPGAGIASLNGLTGAVSLNNASASGSTITVNDASTSAKGIAQFNSANFIVSAGSVNTVQNIGTSATPTFAGLNTNNITIGGETVTDFTGNGLQLSSGALSLAVQANKGLESDGSGLSLIDCANNEILKYSTATNQWACAADSGGGGSGVTTVGTIDSQTKSSDGAVISGNSIYLQTADASFPGLVSTGAQTFAGAKTFNGQIVAAGGIDLGTQTLQGSTVTIDFTNFDVSSAGAVTAANFTGGGSGLTSLNASNIASGTLGDARLSTNVALLNAPANFASSLQQGGNDVCTTAGNCSGLGLAVDSLNSLTGALTLEGTAGEIDVNDNGSDTITLSLNAAVTLQGNTFNGASQLVQLNGSSQLPAVSGALLTSLNASNIASGTVANARLVNGGALTVTAGTNLDGGGSVALGGSVTINVSDDPTFAGDLVVQGGSATLGADAQAGTLVLFDGGTGAASQTGTLQVISTLGQNTVYTLPDPSGATATVCLDTGNCAGAGTGITGSGTTSTIPLFTASQNIGDSIITQSGTTIDIAGSLTLDNALGVAYGGTGLTGTPTNGQLLIGDGTGYSLATLTNNGGITISNGSGSIGLAVVYGSTADTAVEGDTTLTCPSGTGNLTGGGTSITLGTGGTCAALNTVANPTFATSVTTPLVQNAGLTLAATGANDLLLQTNGSTRLTVASGGDLTATGSLALQGGGLTIGVANSQTGSLTLANDGAAFVGSLQVAVLGQDTTYTLPDPSGATAEICLDTGNCAGAGGGITGSGTTNQLSKFTGSGTIGDSSITDDGSTVTTTANMVIQGGGLTVGTTSQTGSLVLNDGNGGQTTTLQAGNSAGDLTFVLPTGAGSQFQCIKKGTGNQLIWDACEGGGGGTSGVTSLNSLTSDLTLQGTTNQITVSDNGGDTITLSLPQNIHSAATPTFGGLTLNGALDLNTNNIIDAGTVNGQTISSSSSFTGTVTVANNLTLTSGDLAVNGGDITSTGALNITPGGALTVGATGQALTLQGDSSTTLSATDSGNTTALIFETPTDDVNYRFVTETAGTYDVCTTAGNCVGLGSSITGSGTSGTISLFTDTQEIGDSIITQSGGTTIDISGSLTLDNALGVAYGGTGLATTPTNGQLLIGNGSGYTLAGLTNDGGLTITNGSGSIGLAVNYGSTANTAVQGNTTLACPSGTGNLTGGGTSITLGTGGTCAALNTVANPTFGTSVTTPVVQNAGLAVASTGANDLLLQTNGSTRLTVASGGGLTATGGLTLQGGTATLGTTSQQGLLVLHDGNGQTATISVGSALAANTALAIPTGVGASDTFCLLTLGNCSGGSATLQAAYDNGNTITTTTNRNIIFNLADTATDSDFAINLQGSDSRFFINGTGTESSGGRIDFGVGSHAPVIFRNDDSVYTGISNDALVIWSSDTQIFSTASDPATDNPLFRMDGFNGGYTFRMGSDSFGKFEFLTTGGSAVFGLNDVNGTGEATFMNHTDSTIGFRILRADTSSMFTVNTSGNRIDIGSTSFFLTSIGTVPGASERVLCINDSTGQVRKSGTTTDCSTSSARFKDDITSLPEEMGLELINALRPVTFTYKSGDGSTKVGLIAEEVEQVLPEVVGYDEEGLPSGINYEYMVANLIKAIQQQQVQIEELQQGVFNGALVEISGHIRVGDDTAGTLTIPAGQTSASVTFNTPYEFVPKITTGTSDYVHVIVTDKTVNGFTVRIQTPHPVDIRIDWTALEVE